MDTLFSILLLTFIFNLYLLFFSLRHLGLILDGGRVPNGNYGPCLPLSKISVLLVIPNVTWYESNQHTNTITRSFSLAVISLVMCLLSLSEFSISNNSSRAGDVFRPILVSLALASFLSCCLLSDDILALKLPYSVVSVVTQDKPHMMYIIPRLFFCPMCNFRMWSPSSTLLLFS